MKKFVNVIKRQMVICLMKLLSQKLACLWLYYSAETQNCKLFISKNTFFSINFQQIIILCSFAVPKSSVPVLLRICRHLATLLSENHEACLTMKSQEFGPHGVRDCKPSMKFRLRFSSVSYAVNFMIRVVLTQSWKGMTWTFFAKD